MEPCYIAIVYIHHISCILHFIKYIIITHCSILFYRKKVEITSHKTLSMTYNCCSLRVDDQPKYTRIGQSQRTTGMCFKNKLLLAKSQGIILFATLLFFYIKWTSFYPSIVIHYTFFKFVSAKYVVICHHQLAGILDVCMQAYQKMDGEEHLSK